MANPDAPNRAYLSLGSNIEPERNLPEAVRRLASFGCVVRASSVWQSPPLGFIEQADFLNGAVLLETGLDAERLKLQAIAGIETALGRVRSSNKNAPRTIDIDIELFNRDIFSVGRRQIPDPELLQRPFVAIPLAEIAPDYVHPLTGETLARIAARFGPAPANMHRRPDVSLTKFIVEC